MNNQSMTALDRVSRARSRLLIQQPFYGTLALRLRLADASQAPSPVATYATDGTTLYVNDAFDSTLKTDERLAVVAHEVMHCALRHVYRMGARQTETWNVACDEIVNELLKGAGFRLPAGCVDGPDARKGWEAERRYQELQKQQQQQQQQQGQGKGKGKGQGNGQQQGQQQQQQGQGQGQGQQGQQPGQSGNQSGNQPWNVGGMLRPPNPNQGQQQQQQGQGQQPQQGNAGQQQGQGKQQGAGSGQGQQPNQQPQGRPMTEQDWGIAVEQAIRTCSHKAGVGFGAVRSMVSKARESSTDWRTILRRFLTSSMAVDYSWMRPSRRGLSLGMHLPGQYKESYPEFCIVVDTSGSISDAMVRAMFGEINAICSDIKPEKVYVLYHHSACYRVDTFEPLQGDVVKPGKQQSGGTNYLPVLKRIKRGIEEDGWQPKACIWLTDLYSSDSPDEPEYPVLWAIPQFNTQTWPWGEVIKVDMGEDGVSY